jgi:hypothetical protein
LRNLTRRAGLGLAAAALSLGLVVLPAVSASAATGYSIAGSVPKNSVNVYFETGRSHGSGPITIKLSSWSPCGNHMYFPLRNGQSASSTKMTETLTVAKMNTTYTFKKKGSSSTTLPSGKYWITGATSANGCNQYSTIAFKGTITL